MQDHFSPIGVVKSTPTQQAPQQQAPQQFSSEQQMHTNAGNEEVHKVEVLLDPESAKILSQVNAIHQASILNLGIKLFAKTNMYKEFMLKEDFKSLEQETENLQEMTDLSAGPSSQPTVSVSGAGASPATATAPAAGGFTSW